MAKKNWLFVLSATFFTFLCCICFAGQVSAIGMVTNEIVIDGAMRGQDIPQTLTIFNSDATETIFELKGEGETAAWTSFYDINDTERKTPITQVKVPAKSNISARVNFEVPNDAANRKYTGVVYLLSSPGTNDDKSKASVTVGQRISRLVSITVTDKQVIKFDTNLIPLKYEYATNEPLIIRAIFDNQGNTVIKPTVQIKITRNGQEVYNAIAPYPENDGGVKPLERKDFEKFIVWQTNGQPSGKYVAEMKVILNDTVYKQDQLNFILGYQYGKAVASLFAAVNAKIPFIFLIALVVFVAVAGWAFIKRNRKKIVL